MEVEKPVRKILSEAQKEVLRARARQWNKDNKERMQANQRNYYENNKEKVKAYGHNYAITHRKENVDRVHAYIKKNPWYWCFASARQRCINAKNPRYKWYGARGIIFLLTKEDCSLLWQRDHAFRMYQPSIDRINNDGNYEFSNCRFIERSENSANKYCKRLLIEQQERIKEQLEKV